MSDKKKILIVEDDVFVREIYNTKFLKEGFDVISAENGVQALEKLSQGIPDLILLDIVMPYMDGIEALKKIKENKNWNKIPIIMLTNISEKDRVEEGTDLGVNDYLIKSHFLPGEVVAKVNSILKK
jgi:DNA-binding response OmpR family regulator